MAGITRTTAYAKLLAAEAALHLCDEFRIKPTTTKRGAFCRLAAVLYGVKDADLQKLCMKSHRTELQNLARQKGSAKPGMSLFWFGAKNADQLGGSFPNRSSPQCLTSRCPTAAEPPAAYTIRQFCEAYGISVPTYYELKKQKLAPAEMRMGAIVRISREAAADGARRAKIPARRKPKRPLRPPRPCALERGERRSARSRRPCTYPAAPAEVA